MDIVFNRFKELIEAKGLIIEKIDDEGFLYIKKGEYDLKVSLDNLKREYEQGRDIECVTVFVEAIMSDFESLPEWKICKDRIFFSFFSSDYDFRDLINYPVTGKINTVFVYSFIQAHVWISEVQVAEWGVSQKELVEAASSNMNRLLDEARIESEVIDGKKLLFFDTENEPFKSSLLVSTNLKAKVENLLGWPVYAVIPVRDFCYLFSEKDLDFFAERLGSTVVKEFTESAYPLSTELIKISNGGIEAIGEYPVE